MDMDMDMNMGMGMDTSMDIETGMDIDTDMNKDIDTDKDMDTVTGRGHGCHATAHETTLFQGNFQLGMYVNICMVYRRKGI
jgi:hypothetical protein